MPLLLCAPPLFNLLLLQLDRLVVDKDSLPLVRLRHSPPPDLGRELVHDLLVDTLEEDSSHLRRAGLDALWHGHNDRVRETELEDNELLPRVLRFVRAVLNCCSVTDSYEAQDRGVPFRYAADVAV